jgi:hypothetical protein
MCIFEKIYDKYLIYYAFRKMKEKKVKNKIHQILVPKQTPSARIWWKDL